MSVKEGQSIGTFNSLVFHTNSTVEFGFAGICDTISDVFVAMSVTICGGVDGSKFLRHMFQLY